MLAKRHIYYLCPFFNRFGKISEEFTFRSDQVVVFALRPVNSQNLGLICHAADPLIIICRRNKPRHMGSMIAFRQIWRQHRDFSFQIFMIQRKTIVDDRHLDRTGILVFLFPG